MEADQIPAELIEAAARAVFEGGEATFDRMDPWEVYVPKKWEDRTEDEKDEVREPTRDALAAVYREIQARALEEFADSITPHVCDVIEDGPRRTREYIANTARSHAAALRTPDAGDGGGERG